MLGNKKGCLMCFEAVREARGGSRESREWADGAGIQAGRGAGSQAARQGSEGDRRPSPDVRGKPPMNIDARARLRARVRCIGRLASDAFRDLR